jgi:hypothetical protein
MQVAWSVWAGAGAVVAAGALSTIAGAWLHPLRPAANRSKPTHRRRDDPDADP